MPSYPGGPLPPKEASHLQGRLPMETEQSPLKRQSVTRFDYSRSPRSQLSGQRGNSCTSLDNAYRACHNHWVVTTSIYTLSRGPDRPIRLRSRIHPDSIAFTRLIDRQDSQRTSDLQGPCRSRGHTATGVPNTATGRRRITSGADQDSLRAACQVSMCVGSLPYFQSSVHVTQPAPRTWRHTHHAHRALRLH